MLSKSPPSGGFLDRAQLFYRAELMFIFSNDESPVKKPDFQKKIKQSSAGEHYERDRIRVGLKRPPLCVPRERDIHTKKSGEGRNERCHLNNGKFSLGVFLIEDRKSV